jgi:ABC-type transport system involved in multi-copper enzyme maturation permease subunit
MNPTLIRSFWLQRLTSPIRLVLLALAFGMPLLTVGLVHGGLSVLGDSWGLVMIFAVGMIGQDLSSGVLQLLFARPVRRSEYVFSRWIAVGAAAAGVALAQTLIAVAFMAARGEAPAPSEIAWLLGQRVLECFGLAAVFTLLSTLVGGFADIALYLVVMLAGGIIQLVGQANHWTVVSRAAEELGQFLNPKLQLAQMVSTSPFPFFPLASFLSTVTLCLVLAVVVMNRRELSYATS